MFENFELVDLIEKVGKNGIRPEINENVPQCYRSLIEKCWSQNPNDRLTFEEIVFELRNNEEFFKFDDFDNEKYQNYIKFIDESPNSFKTEEYIEKRLKYSNTELYLNLDNYKINLYEAIHKETNTSFIKIDLKKNSSLLRNELAIFAREINIITQLDHPSIIRFCGFSDINLINEPKGVILTNCDFNQASRSFLGSENILITLYGIASAMSYLHSHNIIHRNLKIETINCIEFGIPIITGFNIAKEIKGEKVKPNKKIKGTPAYIAPEVYLHEGYSKASDVYSYGLIIYEIITGERPYKEMQSPNEIKKYICEMKQRPIIINHSIPKKYQELIERCLSQNPEDRPTFENIVNELKTDPTYITDDIDKEDFYHFVEYIDEYPIKFDSNRRIQFYDDILVSKLHTFPDIRPNFPLNNLYDTEINNLALTREYINYDNYDNLSFLNIGDFYKVYVVRHKVTNNLFIMKETIKKPLNFYKNEIVNFSRELNILLQIKHPSICKFIGYTKHDGKVLILNEYFEKGSLRDAFEHTKTDDSSHKNSFSLHDTQKIILIYGIACGMSYLHSHNILHRDLKLGNIYLDDSLYPKISGFNIAKEIKGEKVKPNKKIKGTPAYIAPEVYLHEGYSKASDVYSYGLIIYEIITGERPYKEMQSPNEIKKYICEMKQRPIINHSIPKKYQELIERCLSQNPEDRPTFENIVNELKTDPTYITDDIDKDEFLKYIKMIDNSMITFESSNKIEHLKEYVKFYINKFVNFDIKINKRNIFETETNNISFHLNIININSFEKQKLIQVNEKFKLHEVCDKTSGQRYISKQVFSKIKTWDDFLNAKNELLYEIETISEINHEAILKFHGYSCIDFKCRSNPVIFTENASNGILNRVLEFEQKNESNPIFDDTKKLILICGIAIGMKFLHSINIIHCSLNPSNIFLDEFLFPKIAGLDQSKKITQNSFFNIPNLSEEFSDDLLSDFTLSGYLIIINHDIYKAPELFSSKFNHPSQDVYSYAMIVYHIITGLIPISEEHLDLVYIDGFRPKFPESTPKCYIKLIEKCWAKEPAERPTFDEIVYHLKTNPEFITDKVNKEEYLNYIKFVEKTENSSVEITSIDDFIETKNQFFRKVKIDFKKLRDQFLTKFHFSIDVGSINIDNYIKETKIGSGSFGSVYKVIDKRNDKIYAAKVSIYEIDQCPEDVIINMSREIDIISNLDHPAIFKFIGYSPNDFKNIQKPVIITEYALNGSLDKIIEMERQGFSHPEWDDTKKLINIYGIAAGMWNLHKNHILHRDLKPANILIDEFLQPKIADFGLSKRIDYDNEKRKEKKIISSGFKGTYAYCAPEIIKEQHYSEEGDVYAYGMIVYEIMTNEVIYQGLNQFQVIMAVINNDRPKFKNQIPYCYKKLIENCWDKDASKRPHFSIILDILQTDPRFITKNVNKDDFFDYVSLVEDSQNENENIKKSNNNNEKSNKVSFDFNKFEEKIQEEIDENFLDLTKYERKSIISKNYLFKFYQIEEKTTKNIFTAQISMIPICRLSKENKEDLIQEIKNILQMNHPSLLKFIGFSPVDFKNKRNPVVVTESFKNGTLDEIIEIERNGIKISEWNDTKKLIIIYGIATGMAYLHSFNVIHRCLNTKNIFLDEVLCPKIGYFGLSSRFLSQESMTHQSMTKMKFTPIYTAPEVLQNNEYTKKGDVYSFAMIVYEIMYEQKPFFIEINIMNDIMKKIVIENKRPELKETIPLIYRKLIEKCWSKEQQERLSFNEIVHLLKTNSEFITEKVEKENFLKYIKYIDEQTNILNRSLKINELNEPISIQKHIKLAENGNLESIEFLAKKYKLENDYENVYKYFCMLINKGRCTVPLEYAINLYKTKNYKQAFNYFTLISKINHPIALFYIGIMKFWGYGCVKNQSESYNILKNLSDNGIDRATEFLEEYFEKA